MLRCCFGLVTRTSNQTNEDDTFEQLVKQRGIIVDLWLSQKTLRLRRGSSIFVCRRTNTAEREKTVLRKLASAHVPFIVNALEDVPSVICCSYTPGLDLTQCALTMEKTVLRKTLVRVAEALLFCHRHRIVHLDVKPENIVITSTGSVKLIDFEYAREIPPGHARVRLTYRCGTMGYVAPEILLDGRASFSSDVWSFGCVILACCGHMNHTGYPERIGRYEAMPVYKAFTEYQPLLKNILIYNTKRMHMVDIHTQLST